MIKAISTTAPEIFHRDPDGSTVFRWDIQQTVNDAGEMVFAVDNLDAQLLRSLASMVGELSDI